MLVLQCALHSTLYHDYALQDSSYFLHESALLWKVDFFIFLTYNMARSNSSTSKRLIIAIILSSAFFVTELVGETYPFSMSYHVSTSLTPITVGFRTKSLALIADAFHYVHLYHSVV
jgi:Co/Zn/Cd efflux system component